MSTRAGSDPDAPHAPRRIAVAGAGLAGLRTAAALREAGFAGDLSVFGAEGLAPYDRPPLTKELFTRTEPVWLADELGTELVELADRVELATPVRAVSPGERSGAAVRLDLADGSRDEVDVVVIATGSHARAPVDWAGAALLHTAADAAALRARLSPGTRLLCIGAGWIGAELSGVAHRAGCEVVVLEEGAAPLARQLGRDVGRLTAPWYAASGVELHLGARVSAVHPGSVHLADGRRLEADVVLAAVGARPTTGWLDGAVTLTARGAVAVDRAGRATGARLPFRPGGVHAVGDCADRLTERDGLVHGGHWSSALHDPALVALAVLGDPLPPADPAPHTFSHQHGHDLALFGQPDPRHRVVLRGDPAGGGPWTALYVEPAADGSVLAAGLAVDAPRDVGALRRLLGAPMRPVIDLEVAADPTRHLREAARARPDRR